MSNEQSFRSKLSLTSIQVFINEAKNLRDTHGIAGPIRSVDSRQLKQLSASEFTTMMVQLGVYTPAGGIPHLPNREITDAKREYRATLSGGKAQIQMQPMFIPPDHQLTSVLKSILSRTGVDKTNLSLNLTSLTVVGGAPTLRGVVRRYEKIMKDRIVDMPYYLNVIRHKQTIINVLTKITAVGRPSIPDSLPQALAEMANLEVNLDADQGYPYARIVDGAYVPTKLSLASSDQIRTNLVLQAELDDAAAFYAACENHGSLKSYLVDQDYKFVSVLKVKVGRYPFWICRDGTPDAENIERGRPYITFPGWMRYLSSYIEDKFKQSIETFTKYPDSPIGVGFAPFSEAKRLLAWYTAPADYEYLVYGDDVVFKFRCQGQAYIGELDISSFGPSQPKETWEVQVNMIKSRVKMNTSWLNILKYLQMYNYNCRIAYLDRTAYMNFGNADGTSFTTYNNTRLMCVYMEYIRDQVVKSKDLLSVESVITEHFKRMGYKIKLRTCELPTEANLTIEMSDGYEKLEKFPKFLKFRPAIIQGQPVCVFDRTALMEAIVQPSGQTASGEGYMGKDMGKRIQRYYSLMILGALYPSLYTVCYESIVAILRSQVKPYVPPTSMNYEFDVNLPGYVDFAQNYKGVEDVPSQFLLLYKIYGVTLTRLNVNVLQTLSDSQVERKLADDVFAWTGEDFEIQPRMISYEDSMREIKNMEVHQAIPHSLDVNPVTRPQTIKSHNRRLKVQFFLQRRAERFKLQSNKPDSADYAAYKGKMKRQIQIDAIKEDDEEYDADSVDNYYDMEDEKVPDKMRKSYFTAQEDSDGNIVLDDEDYSRAKKVVTAIEDFMGNENKTGFEEIDYRQVSRDTGVEERFVRQVAREVIAFQHAQADRNNENWFGGAGWKVQKK